MVEVEMSDIHLEHHCLPRSKLLDTDIEATTNSWREKQCP